MKQRNNKQGLHPVLREATLRRVVPQVRRKIKSHLEEPVKMQLKDNKFAKTYLIRKDHPNILNRGNLQIVVDVGEYSIGKHKVPLVVKLASETGKFKKTPKDHHIVYVSGVLPRSTEISAEFFRKLGFPVPLMHAFQVDGACNAILSENLQRKNNTISEAYDFDFSQLKNGPALEKEYEKYVKKLEELKQGNKIHVLRHATLDDPTPAFKKAFFVDWEQKTGKGRLVMGDVDHLALMAVGRTIKPVSLANHITRVDNKIRGRITL